MPTFLVLVHEQPEVFGRLVRGLAPHRCVVHVDAGVRIEPFVRAAAGGAHVEFLDDRIDVRWAGFSVVEATIALLEHGLTVTDPDDHLVVLSGTDAIVRPIDEFVAHLRTAPWRQHLRHVLIDGIDDRAILDRIRRRHHRDLRLVRAKRRTGPGHVLNAVARRAAESVERFRPPGPCPDGLAVALGSQWFALTAECVTELLGRRSAAVDDWFRSTFAPDETYFATMLANGPFANDNATGGPEDFVARGVFRLANHHLIDVDLRRVWTLADLREIIDSGRYFVRKLVQPDSLSLLDALDIHRRSGSRSSGDEDGRVPFEP